ncbi:ATP-dependent nuclease [Nocardioides speluncae]|uniref:ATP-dependent nuclease n=1 Tax=Nocardioides speluncae TaxID=2670337 RepID=UPI000D696786|nr:AAA family ATPase [Nocardioides speluncae]
MDIIKLVRIENFRSIRSVTLDGLDSYVPIIGLNSAGKSNVLRALNLFFNNHIDEDRAALDLGADHTSYAPAKQKKNVSVTVGLSLGPHIRVRGQDDFQKNYDLSDVVYIKRTWSVGVDKSSLVEAFSFGNDVENLQPAGAEEVASLATYIRAVRFVYIPNHARPADLIRNELQPLRADLVRRLRSTTAYKESNVPDLMAELGRMGGRMFGEAAKAVERGLPSTSIAASLPADFAELVFTVGINAISDSGIARTPDYEGSGAQSFMLLHILDLADRSRRSSGFGWVQASIWAMEEPESFLHAGLRARFSTDLASYAGDSRRQVIVTTHQDEFARVAEHVWTASKDRATGTQLFRSIARDAIAEATRREITTFRHPLFAFADQPLVIVEGIFDSLYMSEALRELQRRIRWRLIAPSDVFEADAGGDGVLQYLKYNKQAIASRPDSAPVIVVRDWEDKSKAKYDNVLAVHPHSTCVIADETLTNPQLDETFVGIERYLPTDLIKEQVPTQQLALEHSGSDARFSIKRPHLEAAKPRLADAVRSGASPGEHMRDLASWLDEQVIKILESVPPEKFL